MPPVPPDRLQTRGTSSDERIRRASGVTEAFKIIWERQGARGFLRGLTPRVVTYVPSNALSWLAYEVRLNVVSL